MALKVAYMTSRFPKASETFVLYELLDVQKLSGDIHIFSILRQQESVKHPEVEALMDRTHYANLDVKTLSAQFYWLSRAPRRYLKAWFKAISGNLSSPKFLSRAVVVMPKAAAFAREMEELGIEHIHAHWATHPTLGANLINELTDIPYSFMAHAHDIYVNRTMLEEKIQDSAFVATISEYNRRFLRGFYGDLIDEKVKIIRCGVDTSLFSPRERSEPNEKFTIATVARLAPMKGIPYLVEACKILKDQNIDFICKIIGDGDERANIEAQIVSLGLGDHIELMGWQTRPQVLELLSQADAMVLPSVITGTGKMEGVPVALMEALAMTLPVVASDISGVPELVIHEKTGMLAKERDPKGIADALIRIQQNPEWAAELGQAGREHVLANFDQKKNADALYALMTASEASSQQVAQAALAT